MTTETGSSVSLPSFRDGIEFSVRPLNLGGTRALVKAKEGGASDFDVAMVMLTETLKREFPNVEQQEIDRIEQEDYLKLVNLMTLANDNLAEKTDDKVENPITPPPDDKAADTGFTPPTK